jgi:hypothetical protein
MGCNDNALIIGRPSANGSMDSYSCSAACSELGPTDPLNKNELGPRRSRTKVKGQIREYILNMLGAPRLKIELDEQNIDFCVDQALMVFADYAPREYFNYYTFNTIPGKSVYKMPAEVGLIRDVFYQEAPQSNIFTGADLGGVYPIEYFYNDGSSASGGMFNPVQPVWGKMSDWTLYKQYENMYSRLSSNLGGWEWVSDYSHIKLYPIPYGSKPVAVHYLQQLKDWQQVKQAMQEGALSYAKEILGRIRGKFKNPPGPNGGLQLDGDQLLMEAKEERTKWMEDLINKFGDLPYISMG